MRLDLRHERELRVDLRLRERLNSDNKAALRAATPVAAVRSATVTVTSFADAPGSGRQTAAQVSFQVWGSERLWSLLVTVTVQFLPSTPKSCRVGKNILRGQILAARA